MLGLKNKRNFFFASFILFSSLFMIQGLYNIYLHDQTHKNIIIAKDFSSLQNNLSTQKSAIIEAIEKLKFVKTNNLIIQEDTIETLINNGKITLQTGAHLLNSYRVGRVYRSPVHNLKKGLIKPHATYLFVDEYILYERIRNFLIANFGESSIVEKGWNTLEIFLDPHTLKSTGIGFSAKNILFFKSLNISLIPKIKVNAQDTSDYHALKLQNIQENISPKVLITEFSDTQHHPNILEKYKRFFQENKIHNVFIEFDNNQNQSWLAKQIPGKTLKAHTLNYMRPGSLQNIDQWITRYLRSVKERRVKLIILDPQPLKERFNLNPDEINKVYSELYTRLQEMGYSIDGETIVSPNDWKALNPNTYLLIQLTSVLLIVLFLKKFFFYNPSLLISSCIFILFSILFQSELEKDFLPSQTLALLLSCFAPAYVFKSYYPENKVLAATGSRIKSLLLFILKSTALLSFVGILIVLLHSDLLYLNGFLKFYGVKISFIMPLLFVALSFYLQPSSWSSLGHVFNRILKLPLSVGGILAAFLGALIIFIYVLRSGNYFAISFSELFFREFIENLFFIRPRMKEILIGYPLIVVNIFLIGAYISEKWLWFFNMIASIAFVSLLNSFCHFHTPVEFTFLRSFLGLCLGLCFGALFVLIFKTLKLSPRKT